MAQYGNKLCLANVFMTEFERVRMHVKRSLGKMRQNKKYSFFICQFAIAPARFFFGGKGNRSEFH